MRYRWYKAGWEFIDLLIPPQCGGCEKWGERWCQSCQDEIRIINRPVCPICGEPQSESIEKPCARRMFKKPSFISLRSYAIFSGPLQNAIHRLKYKRDLGLGESLSRHLIALFEKLSWETDLITVVPLDEQRMTERGYNQSTLLARPLAWASGTPFSPQAISRIRKTESQVGLTREERRINVAGAFLADSKMVSGRSILIVDDVATTGATMESSSKALLNAGASEVYGLTLARSVNY